MERPVGNDSHPLTVVFSLSLIQIMDVVGVSTSCSSSTTWLSDELWSMTEYISNIKIHHDVFNLCFFLGEQQAFSACSFVLFIKM